MRMSLRRGLVVASVLVLTVSACTAGGSGSGVGEVTLPTTDIRGFTPQFGSVEEMAASSDLVAVASVVGLEPQGVLVVDEDPNPSEWTLIRFEVEEVLAGEPVDEVSVMWETYGTDGEGRRVLEFTLDGVPLPDVGDRYVLFLKAESESRAAVFGGRSSHALVASSGMMAIVDGKVASEYRGGSPVGRALDGFTVDEAAALLGG